MKDWAEICPDYLQRSILTPDSTYRLIYRPINSHISQFGEKIAQIHSSSYHPIFSDSDLEVKLVDMPQNMFKVTLPEEKARPGKVWKRQNRGSLMSILKKEFEKSITIEFNDTQKTAALLSPSKEPFASLGQIRPQRRGGSGDKT